MTGHVLVVNAGSSSVKLAVVDPDTGHRPVTALAERLGSPDAALHVHRAEGPGHAPAAPDPAGGAISADEALTRLVEGLTDAERSTLTGVGHRVVHGGSRFSDSVVVDAGVRADLDRLVALAPLHMPANLRGVEVAQAALPDLPHVAVFDTAFHQTMEPVAYRYAVPTAWYADHGVRRYGFHGTSHRFVSERAAELLGRPLESLRLVTLHLGNGCSAAAVDGGRSVDTTMGLTPLEGLVMGTRSGDVDPGVIGYVAAQEGVGAEEVLAALNSRSGLLGLSGLSNDMRTLCDAAEAGSEPATLAVQVFCYRVAKTVGALTVALGGLDAVVFTGGIGEHSSLVRSRVLDRLAVLGLHEDPEANARHGRGTGGRVDRATDPSSTAGPAALVVPTDEELVIARDTARLVSGGTP
ncbi:acetate kinase [Nocardioides sp. HDW12B]|uniref:acetate/propionate family kinase n=1 Tax=Nocardioides sp. HDW12B TaxID=2714939 RepID=UPI00140801D0|nr:acetate kinase [Nocardioides sp. HDW12B]QIK67669.1 acetate kinase [Nocardioides sp. HDW12B]